MNRRLLALTYGTSEPASRFRLVQYIPGLEAAGWSVLHRPCSPPRPWNPALRVPLLHPILAATVRHRHRAQRDQHLREAPGCDAVFVNRDILHGNPDWEARLGRLNPRWIFDFDDNLFAGRAPAHAEFACRNAAWVVAGNPTLAELARRFTDRVSTIPTCVDVDRYTPATAGAPDHANPPLLRLGWCGSEGSIHDTLGQYLHTLENAHRTTPFELVVISDRTPRWRRLSFPHRFIPWSPAIEHDLGAHMDCGLMPLVDTPFHHGKCGLKILLYQACALPVIASPIGINATLVQHRLSGLLASSQADWTDAIASLHRDRTCLPRLGQAGRDHCRRRFHINLGLHALRQVLDTVASPSAG